MLIKRQEYFFVPLFLLLVTLTATNFIPLVTAVLVIIFAMALSFYQYFWQHNKPIGFYLCWLVAIILGVAVGVYRPSDFNYPLVFSVNQFYEGGLPFSLYVNIAKLFAGYIIICLLFTSKSQSNIYIKSRVQQYLLAVGLGLLILIVAYHFLDFRFHLKALNYILLFAAVNLLVTCVTEEAFMRLLLQAELQKLIARKFNNRYAQEIIPLLLATLVFVLTHFTHDAPTMWVFGLAGFIYSVVYCLTKNLWACIVVHFTVNIMHFAFLTYPLA